MAIQGLSLRVESKNVKIETEAIELETAIIPFINGLSQEIRRITITVGVRRIFSTSNTTRRMYSAKDQLLVESVTHAAYTIRRKTCEEEYLGQTLRAVSVRCKKHRDTIPLGHTAKSAAAEHVHCQKVIHEIDWNNVQAIDHAKRKWERKVREVLQLQKRNPHVNRDKGTEISDTWSVLIS